MPRLRFRAECAPARPPGKLIICILGFRQSLWRLWNYLMGSGCCFGNGKHCNFEFSEEVCMLKKKRKDMGGGHILSSSLEVSGTRTRCSLGPGEWGQGAGVGQPLENQASQCSSTQSLLPYFGTQRSSETPSPSPSLMVPATWQKESSFQGSLADGYCSCSVLGHL